MECLDADNGGLWKSFENWPEAGISPTVRSNSHIPDHHSVIL